jgi:UDP-N-acetylglucosamine--N-acetylmuramyl-(pentapeptide) pyrophosphoryl-undecaprenol N-acetylglucosamine transferase
MSEARATVLIMAGGTGGHVFPGLAVARELLARNIKVAWLGTQRGIEARAVPASGLPIELDTIAVQGVRRTGAIGWLLLPFMLVRAMVQAFRVLRRRKPAVVLSFGGFVAGPGGLVAWLTGTPLLVHEANAIPGFTNKQLAMFARQVLTGFPGGFGSLVSARQVGNPVRSEIAAIETPTARLTGRVGRLRVLVVGGSQGARVFNDVVPQALKSMAPERRPQVRHQTGRDQREATLAAYGDVRAEVVEFIDDMANAYRWADLVIARSGAMTVAEICAAGCCAILTPYPHATDDHQTANARYLVTRQAATLVPQQEFTATRIATLMQNFADNRGLILEMARAARSLAVPDAAQAVANACEELLHA